MKEELKTKQQNQQEKCVDTDFEKEKLSAKSHRKKLTSWDLTAGGYHISEQYGNWDEWPRTGSTILDE